MRAAAIVGVILIALGIVSLAYQGVGYTTHKKVLDIGPIRATEQRHHTIPLPPALGALSLIAGVVLLVAGSRKAT